MNVFSCNIVTFTLYVSFLFSTTFFANASNVESTQINKLNDGPYVNIENNRLSAFWFCQNTIKRGETNIHKLPWIIEGCIDSVAIDRIGFAEQTVLEYQGDFDVVASSDFHGQYALMKELLVNNQIIDEQGHWAFGDGHFVITGDVFDRGDKVTEILWFLYRLEQEAIKAGGQLHLLLGNHEVMVLNGDLRYVNDKYIDVSTRVNKAYEELYGKDTVLGRWLRSKPVLVKINGILFAHGGFHPSLAKEQRTLKQINTVFKQNLVKAELKHPREGWGEYLHKTNGPIWYRGYFKDDGANATEIDMLLSHFDVKHLVVGHTSQKQIETRYQGRVIAIDSSIKNGEYGELLLIRGEKKWRGTLLGEKIALN